MMQDKYIRFDWAMKRMLRDKANFVVLEGLLTVLLERKITILEILESEANQTNYDDKFNRVDIKAKRRTGTSLLLRYRIHGNCTIWRECYMVFRKPLRSTSLWGIRMQR